MCRYVVRCILTTKTPYGERQKMEINNIVEDCYNEDEAVCKAINELSDDFSSVLDDDIEVLSVFEYPKEFTHRHDTIAN